MKNLNVLDEYRVPINSMMGDGIMGDETCGKFIIPSENKRFNYLVIASIDGDWDHVSVSLLTLDGNHPLERCPRWNEMCFIKDLFFKDEEEVIQFHPKKSEYVNIHPYVLHMWRPHQDFLKPLSVRK